MIDSLTTVYGKEGSYLWHEVSATSISSLGNCTGSYGRTINQYTEVGGARTHEPQSTNYRNNQEEHYLVPHTSLMFRMIGGNVYLVIQTIRCFAELSSARWRYNEIPDD